MHFTLTKNAIIALDIHEIQPVILQLAQDPLKNARSLGFQFDYPRDPEDPRELSELDEIRLWFIRLDSAYPWLPYFLDWRAGELTRYAAMLVPHRFTPKEGIEFNTEALQIFVFHKIFVIQQWLASQEIQNHADLRYLAQSLGYDLDPTFFNLL